MTVLHNREEAGAGLYTRSAEDATDTRDAAGSRPAGREPSPQDHRPILGQEASRRIEVASPSGRVLT